MKYARSLLPLLKVCGGAKSLAAMFYAPVIMYMGIWDRQPGRAAECEAAIKAHVKQFCKMTKS